jgi:uncharacterized membrane protein
MRLPIVPLACLVTGVMLAVATLSIDRATDYDLVSHAITGGPSAAQTLLSTILTSLVTLISVVLTVMTVAVQLAMGQFSPRIVTALLRERENQLAFGLFSGSTAFIAVAIRDINGSQVPGVTVSAHSAVTREPGRRDSRAGGGPGHSHRSSRARGSRRPRGRPAHPRGADG